MDWLSFDKRFAIGLKNLCDTNFQRNPCSFGLFPITHMSVFMPFFSAIVLTDLGPIFLMVACDKVEFDNIWKMFQPCIPRRTQHFQISRCIFLILAARRSSLLLHQTYLESGIATYSKEQKNCKVDRILMDQPFRQKRHFGDAVLCSLKRLTEEAQAYEAKNN